MNTTKSADTLSLHTPYEVCCWPPRQCPQRLFSLSWQRPCEVLPAISVLSPHNLYLTLAVLQVLHDQIVQFTDAGAATGNAVVTFEKDSLSLLAPRGRFDVEMYLSSLKLTGQVRRLHSRQICI